MKNLIDYSNTEQTQGLLVSEECLGFLYVEPTGAVDLETASRLMSLVGDYSKKNNDLPVVLLVDNSKVKSIEPEARSYVLNVLKKNPL
jgi:ABC-type lipoprotein export system ATPase subunit